MDVVIHELVTRLGKALTHRELLLTTAESCTGGWIAEVITSVAGSSTWFDRGFVTYSNLSKQEMLGVSATTLEAHGAVSEEVAREMATGTLIHSIAHTSLAVSGIAGPSGGTLEKPVGMVCFAWAMKRPGNKAITRLESTTRYFSGDRKIVRQQAVVDGLRGMVEMIGEER
uniref:Nicotinamide-nucleotide amidase n=1 Tax=Candidatus Kentrum sp. TUN TaxID=2126343 RepID=A0A450ZEL3_9GAMM|nr:MAG: nicotinamide-nucleotide amidase [Candidatus Kentron sp. TUN]VFK52432.1 MAG: nicotinamide-nucleotide amidase [Candidatus Kentron sp. TUN]VFK61933.1 MAG: nicotinamide-nucleotide amidase [Candidatus Kentron sp. TUN]